MMLIDTARQWPPVKTHVKDAARKVRLPPLVTGGLLTADVYGRAAEVFRGDGGNVVCAYCLGRQVVGHSPYCRDYERRNAVAGRARLEPASNDQAAE